MPSAIQVRDIDKALQQRLFPTITTWNRLEARPRTIAFDRALRAEVRDALWMLCKQWQMGEFKGSDAGSPAFAKVQMDLARVSAYRPGSGDAQPFDPRMPLDAKVEHRPVPMACNGSPLSLDLRMAIGRQWLALIDGIGNYRQAFIDAYPIVAPDPTNAKDAGICAHPEVWQTFAALAGRAMDGGSLIEHLAVAVNHAYDGVAGISPGDFHALDDRATRLLRWYERLIAQPALDAPDAWNPQHLEYQFAVSALTPDGTEKVYVAEEFYRQDLDWYSVDVDAAAKPLAQPSMAPATQTLGTTIPVPVSFTGMPNTRWWTFEEKKTNFGDIDAATTDLAKLLFIEFALVYSNDWFVIPFTLPGGSIATVGGLVVTNVFGERFLVDAAGSASDESWQRWSLFALDVHGKPGVALDHSLLLLPTVAKRHESAPTEDVMLVRDEAANMVWGIETTVPLANGDSKRGLEVARQTRAYFEKLLAASGVTPADELPPAAPISYRVMSTVPENWIPFIPVHVAGSNREIQLQRAALLRTLEGDPSPPPVAPRTMLLRQGLDDPTPASYFIYEEEVPRAGARLFQAFERARWTAGSVITWLRVRKQTGRGEAQSGLAFDQLADTPPSSDPSSPADG